MKSFGVARKYAKDLPKYLTSLKQSNIDAYEMGFAYGIPSEFSNEVLDLSDSLPIKISGHLPFWINLGNSEYEKNLNYLVAGLKIAEIMKSVVVFHLGFYGKKKFNFLKSKIIKIIQEAINISRIKKGKLGIETTGKQKAIGTIDEILQLVHILDDSRVIPIIDWSHLYARNDGFSLYSIENFNEILEKVENKLNYKPFYFHGGGIEYKNGNEVKHKSARCFEPPLPYLFAAMKDRKYSDFTLIIESPDSINDVNWLKEVWKTPEKYFKKIPPQNKKSLLDFI